ncbi:MAG: hypothetical protein EP312_07610 [Gammaproteobacteria bacterium]|nr:MAG: hypothetical protein EP312_07610 [Gammaproteobacteria bacterium]
MSLANHQAFPADADVLLRYGVLRQHADQLPAGFTSIKPVPHTCLPVLTKPGVWESMRLATLVGQPVVIAQRDSAWLNQLLWELASGTFIRGLENVTGLQHLLPDPAFHQGGWLPASHAQVQALHPVWRLSACLVLDVLLSAQARASIGDHTHALAAGESLLWQMTDAGPQPAWDDAAQLLRVVYYRGAEDA